MKKLNDLFDLVEQSDLVFTISAPVGPLAPLKPVSPDGPVGPVTPVGPVVKLKLLRIDLE